MRLYRIFDWNGQAMGAEIGGPLHIPRNLQGTGRHDIPDQDGVLYASFTPLSAIAEWLQLFRMDPLNSDRFSRPNGMTRSLAFLEVENPIAVADLDDPHQLIERTLRPSQVATYRRNVTQTISLRLFKEGKTGFIWWSALEASWMNITLFESRIAAKLSLFNPPQKLDIHLAEVQSAAEALGMIVDDSK